MYYCWCMLMIHIFTDLTTHLALFQQNFIAMSALTYAHLEIFET